MDQLFQALLPSFEHFRMLGYWFAFFSALLETALVVGLFLPGSVFLLLLGGLTANGYFDFGDILWFAIFGAILGDNLNYWLGQRYGNRWLRDGIWFLTAEHFQKAQQFFDLHGGKSVFLGRFIPSLKEIAPFIAGTVGMHYRTFLFWNVLGAIGWGLQWVGAGYLFGQSIKLAQVWISRAGLLLLLVVIIWILLWLLQRFVMRQGREVWRFIVSFGRSFQVALRHNLYLRRWVRKHPKSIHFLATRIDRSHFYGLPLTLLSLIFIYVLALFAGLVEDIFSSDPIVSVDHATAQLIAAFRDPAVIPPFVWISNLADIPLVAVLLLVACLGLWLVNRKFAAAGLVMSTLGSLLFLMLSQLAIHRSQPIEAVISESSFSFPSGHATVALTFYGFIGYLLIRSAMQWHIRVKLFFSIGGLVLAIGLSRMVLGIHYLSDVWAGYLVGTLWLIAGVSVNEWLCARGQIEWNVPINKQRSAAVLGLTAIAFVGVISYVVMNKPLIRTPTNLPTTEINRPLLEVLKAQKLSQTMTILGAPSQPLAFAIVTPDEQALITRLTQTGWKSADPPEFRNLLRLVKEGIDYTTAPLAPGFWNGQINNLAFEQSLKNTPDRTLTTILLWRTSFQIGANLVYVGIAREYDGIRWFFLHTVSRITSYNVCYTKLLRS